VDAEVVVPILKRVKAVLVVAIAGVKVLVGLDLSVILALSGKVLTTIDLCHILAVVLAVRSKPYSSFSI